MLILLMLALSNSAPPVHPAPAVDQAMARCSDPLLQAQQPSADRAPLSLDRSLAGEQVRRYLLLDRRDADNCPLPISYSVPDQRALGRNLLSSQPNPALRRAPPAPHR
jgi:hypothetical protein